MAGIDSAIPTVHVLKLSRCTFLSFHSGGSDIERKGPHQLTDTSSIVLATLYTWTPDSFVMVQYPCHSLRRISWRSSEVSALRFSLYEPVPRPWQGPDDVFHSQIFFVKCIKLISYQFFCPPQKIFHFGASFVLFCLMRMSQVIKALSSTELRLTVPRSRIIPVCAFSWLKGVLVGGVFPVLNV